MKEALKNLTELFRFDRKTKFKLALLGIISLTVGFFTMDKVTGPVYVTGLVTLIGVYGTLDTVDKKVNRDSGNQNMESNQ